MYTTDDSHITSGGYLQMGISHALFNGHVMVLATSHDSPEKQEACKGSGPKTNHMTPLNNHVMSTNRGSTQ